MATDIERLIVSLEASTSKYERALVKANQQTDQRVRAMQSRFDSLGNSVSKVERGIVGSLGTVGRAFGVLGIALTTSSIVSMTSAWTDLNSRVSNAAGGIDRGTAVLERLSEMARRTYSSLNQTAESYLGNSQALTALGYSTEQQLDLVESLNNSLVISAVRGDRAKSVMDAWSKAMAGGKLSGDDLNTIIQSGGRLSKALADSMGVSVNELRKLGAEGKITTAEMFGVTSQLALLREEAEAMPATVTDGFVLLSDAVMVFIGQADQAVGSSGALAEALISVSDAIKNAPDEAWFDKVFGALGDELARTIKDGGREIEYIASILEFMAQLGSSPADALVGLNQEMGGAVRTAEEYELALTDAEQALSNLATNTQGRFGDADAAVQDLFAQILKGRGSVESAHAAVDELAKVNPEFADLKAGVLSVIDSFFAMRDAAIAARDAAANTTTDLGNSPTWRQFNKEFGPDLSSDGAPGGPIRPPSSGGGGGKSSGEKYSDSITQFQRRIDMLKQETALTAALNPMLNDYGFAKEKLRAIQELENAATRAGITVGAEQRAQIEQLATGYANATAEAGRLAEAQNRAKESADALAQAGRQALDTIVDGFLEGKDAGEVLQSVVKDLTRSLITMGLNAIGGGLFGGGGLGGIFGGLFGGRGFASGTANTGGARGQPRGVVHGQEAVIPLPSGGRVPVDIRMPTVPAAGGASGTVQIVLEVQEGSAFTTRILQVSGPASAEIASRTVKGYDSDLGSRSAEKQARFG